MVSQSNVNGLQARPGWHSIRALREGRLCVFSTQEANVMVRPGPRMAEAARLMAQCIARKGAVASTGGNP
jgi:iron complex transport system substrate-binding protein